MKLAKRLLLLSLTFALILSMLFVSSCVPQNNENEGGNDNIGGVGDDGTDENVFTPILRFAITSDVHVRSTKDDKGSSKKLERFLGSAYEYAEGDSVYSSLDGIFIVGDITQDGKVNEYRIVKDLVNRIVDKETTMGMVMGNHEMHDFGSGDDRFLPENIANATARFKSQFGYDSEDRHYVINGYHFIAIANDSYETRNYFNEETLAWLKGEIEAAIADDPTSDKPIFVMQHEPPKSDVRGFTGGDTALGELLKNYPRVVDFSGHTHRSILDPQSIWQDGFTAIGTGGLAYLGYNMAGHPVYDNKSTVAIDDDGAYAGSLSTATRTGAMYYIVEVDADNNIRLKIYDLLTESFYGEPIIFKVGEGNLDTFTPEREDKSIAPVFGENAKIDVISSEYNYPVISFSTPTAGDLVQYYRIELWSGGNEPARVIYRLGGMHNAAKSPKSATAPLRGTDPGEYTIKIYAFNCWGKESLPIVGSITVGERIVEADILRTEFGSDGTAKNGDELLSAVGNPTISYDEELARNVASFDGNDGYKFGAIKDYYDEFYYSLTMEAYFKPDADIETAVAIGSNTNSSGFGLSRSVDGSIKFLYGYNNGAKRYVTVRTAANTSLPDEWVHVVVSVDLDYVRIYVNGEQVMLYGDDGEELGYKASRSGLLFDAPTGAAETFVVGADVSSSGGIETGFVGKIAAMNIYSLALTADEVGAIWEELQTALPA